MMQNLTKPKVIEAFTDGACKGNPGPGGWGVVLRYGEHEKHLSGGEAETTNNRMELLAAIMALESLKYPCVVHLTTDSNYLRLGITDWIHNWQRRGWLNSNKEPVKNIDLWQRLLAATKNHEVHWHWVKGHSGHKDNDKADFLARQGIINLQQH